MTINKIRSILYTSAKMLGDVNSINKGKIGQRIFTRIAGRITGRFLRKVIKIIFK